MNVIFHSNQLSLRGTEVALYDYAHYNESLLNNVSYIAAPTKSDLSSLDKFLDRFGSERVLLYESFSDLTEFTKKHSISHSYIIKAGYNDGQLIPDTKNFVHAVFDASQPHGDTYMAISSWLADKHNVDYLPHIVSLPSVEEDFREYLGIPETATVFGRHGGNDTFDVPYLREVISAVISNTENVYFVLMNTDNIGIHHPRLIYVSGTTSVETKTAFINTCDAMIHARQMGESFGLAVCEFLHQNKPVITNLECRDKHHIRLMKNEGYYYTNANELFAILYSFKKQEYNVSHLVEQFKPEYVMNKFKTFLK